MAAFATSRYTRWQLAQASEMTLVASLTASWLRICDARYVARPASTTPWTYFFQSSRSTGAGLPFSQRLGCISTGPISAMEMAAASTTCHGEYTSPYLLEVVAASARATPPFEPAPGSFVCTSNSTLELGKRIPRITWLTVPVAGNERAGDAAAAAEGGLDAAIAICLSTVGAEASSVLPAGNLFA